LGRKVRSGGKAAENDVQYNFLPPTAAQRFYAAIKTSKDVFIKDSYYYTH
jgi:hypothetical protein